MSRFGDGEPVVVRIGECACPGTPHADDEVYLRPKLDYAGGAAALAAMVGPVETLSSRLVPVYIEHGVLGWNLVGDDGLPLAYEPDLILGDWEIAYEVGDRADDLYSQRVLAPLIQRASNSSPPTSDNEPTRANRTGSPTRPKPSKPSSISTIPTDATETTSDSPAGASRPSRSSRSAA